MFYILGIVVVFGSVVLGYTMHHGDLRVLYQPNEFVIILGAGLGSVLIGFPLASLKRALAGFKQIMKGAPYVKKDRTCLL